MNHVLTRCLSLSILGAFLLAFPACEKSDSDDPPAPVEGDGTWKGYLDKYDPWGIN